MKKEHRDILLCELGAVAIRARTCSDEDWNSVEPGAILWQEMEDILQSIFAGTPEESLQKLRDETTNHVLNTVLSQHLREMQASQYNKAQLCSLPEASKKRKYFHIVTDPLYGYTSVESCRRDILLNGLKPKLPFTRSQDENSVISRVCLAPSVSKCMQSIGFCLGPYNIKPIIIAEFNLPEAAVYKPSVGEVPDVCETGEVWALRTIYPEEAYIVLVNNEVLQELYSGEWKPPADYIDKHNNNMRINKLDIE